MLHAVATHLRINLPEARSGFGLFGRYSYTTVLVMKILNINGIRNDQNPAHLGNAVQWSLLVSGANDYSFRMQTTIGSYMKLLLV